MQVITHAVNRGSETPARPQNPDVMLRNRGFERDEVPAAVQAAAALGENVEHTPSAYLVLLSRVENTLRRGLADRTEIERLARLLSDRIGTMSPRARRGLEELPELEALGLENLNHLPGLVRRRLDGSEEAGPVLALLKAPAFVAAVKDEARAQTYGPRGLLRAS